MNVKKKAVLERIESIERAIGKATEYLEIGKHAQWSGFRPWLVHKLKDGKELPPHKDWVKNVFLLHKQKALSRAEKLLERLSGEEQLHMRDEQITERTRSTRGSDERLF